MDRNKETLETWNKVASLYQEKFMDLDLYNDSYDFICDSVKKTNAKILDVGCGPGNITRSLLSKSPDFKILGIDYAENMIALAKDNYPTASFAVMDVSDISNLLEKYDVIICGFCLPYLSQPDSVKLIEDSYKLLNEEGLLYLSFVEGDPSKSGFKASSTGDRTFFCYHQLEELKTQLIGHNFEVLRVSKVDYKKSETEKEQQSILIGKK